MSTDSARRTFVNTDVELSAEEKAECLAPKLEKRYSKSDVPYEALPAKIFEAWTDPEQLKNWMGPSDDFKIEVETDARVGGRYRFQVTPHSGSIHVAVGEYRGFDLPKRLVFTWSWEDNELADGSVVTVELTEAGGDRDLLLRHEPLANQQSRDHHTEGWNGCLARLEKALST